MGTRTPTISDSVKWLLADDSRISLFLTIANARTMKIKINDEVRELINKGILKHDQYGTRLSETGRRCVEAIEGILFLDQI